jgi:uncharacterized protein (TIGR02147 family)
MINVYEYADFRRYLKDWFEAKKANNARFSHRAFARRLGSTDPSLLTNVISGRRALTAERTEDFARVLGLEGDEAEYFRLLVRFGQAATPAERERAHAEMAVLRGRIEAPEIDSARFLYLSGRLYPALHDLAKCVGFRAEPAWVARALDCTEDEAAQALELLLQHRFLVRDGDRVVAAEPVVRTSERVSNLGSYGYERQNLARAAEVLEELWEPGSTVDRRTAFLGYSLAIPHHRIDEVRTLLWEAFLRVMHECEAWSEPDQVFQLNVQLFPVSRITADAPEDPADG